MRYHIKAEFDIVAKNKEELCYILSETYNLHQVENVEITNKEGIVFLWGSKNV